MHAFARGEQQVEEHVALVEAALAVAAARRQVHQVELGRARRRRERAVVEPDRADDAERHVAQAVHRRERDHAGGHAAARRVVESLFERGAHDVERQRRGEFAAAPLIGQAGDLGVDVAQVLEVGVGRGDEVAQRVGQDRGPVGRRARRGDAVAQRLQRIDEAPERAQRQRARALGVAGGQACPGTACCSCVGQRVAEEQAVEAVGEAVARLRRHVEAAAVLGVECPVDAGGHQPVADLVEVVLGEAEAARDDRLLQQAEHVVDGEARRHERQHIEQRARRRVDLRAGAAADRVGQVTLARRGAEDGVDQRRGGVEVGRDDEDVARLRRVGRPAISAEQAVVQHLELARERVADVHLDAAVACQRGERPGGQLDHLEHRVLQRAEHAARGGRERRPRPRRRRPSRRRPAGPAPTSSAGPRPRAGGCLRLVMVGLAARSQPGEAARLDDVEPELPARVEHVDMQLDVPPEPLQQLEVHRRHRRQAEDVGAGGHLRHAGQAGCPARPAGRAARGSDGGRRWPSPARACATARPAIAGRARRLRPPPGRCDGLVAEPRFQPLGTVDEVLFEQPGHALGQLVAHHRVGLRQPGRQPRLFAHSTAHPRTRPGCARRTRRHRSGADSGQLGQQVRSVCRHSQ